MQRNHDARWQIVKQIGLKIDGQEISAFEVIDVKACHQSIPGKVRSGFPSGIA
jgi:hypothetical protein